MIACKFRKKDHTHDWQMGYFHGFFQDGSMAAGFRVVAYVHSMEQIESEPIKIIKPESNLKFLNFVDGSKES